MKIYYPDGSVYEGDVSNQQKHGYGLYANGQMIQEGYFEDDKFMQGKQLQLDGNVKKSLDGDFNYKDNNIIIVNATLVITVDDFQVLSYSGTLINDLFEDQGILQTSTYFYQGQFLNSMKNGSGALHNISRDYNYNGQFKQDNLHGFGEFSTQSFKYSGMFENNEFLGSGEYQSDSFQIIGNFTKNMYNSQNFKLIRSNVDQINITPLNFGLQPINQDQKTLIQNIYNSILNQLQNQQMQGIQNKVYQIVDPWNFQFKELLTNNQLYSEIKKIDKNQNQFLIEFANFITFTGQLEYQVNSQQQQQKLIDVRLQTQLEQQFDQFTIFGQNEQNNHVLHMNGIFVLPDDNGEYKIKIQNSELIYLEGYLKDEVNKLYFKQEIENEEVTLHIICNYIEYCGSYNFGVFTDKRNKLKYQGYFKNLRKDGFGEIIDEINNTIVQLYFNDDVVDFSKEIKIKQQGQNDVVFNFFDANNMFTNATLNNNMQIKKYENIDIFCQIIQQFQLKFEQHQIFFDSFSETLTQKQNDNVVFNKISSLSQAVVKNRSNLYIEKEIGGNDVLIGQISNFQLNGIGMHICDFKQSDFKLNNMEFLQFGYFINNQLQYGIIHTQDIQTQQFSIKIGQFTNQKLEKQSILLQNDLFQDGYFTDDQIQYGDSYYLQTKTKYQGEYTNGQIFGAGKFENQVEKLIVNSVFQTQQISLQPCNSNQNFIQQLDEIKLQHQLKIDSLYLSKAAKENENQLQMQLLQLQSLCKQTFQLFDKYLQNQIFKVNSKIIQPVGKINIVNEYIQFKGELLNNNIIGAYFIKVFDLLEINCKSLDSSQQHQQFQVNIEQFDKIQYSGIVTKDFEFIEGEFKDLVHNTTYKGKFTNNLLNNQEDYCVYKIDDKLQYEGQMMNNQFEGFGKLRVYGSGALQSTHTILDITNIVAKNQNMLQIDDQLKCSIILENKDDIILYDGYFHNHELIFGYENKAAAIYCGYFQQFSKQNQGILITQDFGYVGNFEQNMFQGQGHLIIFTTQITSEQFNQLKNDFIEQYDQQQKQVMEKQQNKLNINIIMQQFLNTFDIFKMIKQQKIQIKEQFIGQFENNTMIDDNGQYLAEDQVFTGKIQQFKPINGVIKYYNHNQKLKYEFEGKINEFQKNGDIKILSQDSNENIININGVLDSDDHITSGIIQFLNQVENQNFIVKQLTIINNSIKIQKQIVLNQNYLNIVNKQQQNQNKQILVNKVVQNYDIDMQDLENASHQQQQDTNNVLINSGIKVLDDIDVFKQNTSELHQHSIIEQYLTQPVLQQNTMMQTNNQQNTFANESIFQSQFTQNEKKYIHIIFQNECQFIGELTDEMSKLLTISQIYEKFETLMNIFNHNLIISGQLFHIQQFIYDGTFKQHNKLQFLNGTIQFIQQNSQFSGSFSESNNPKQGQFIFNQHSNYIFTNQSILFENEEQLLLTQFFNDLFECCINDTMDPGQNEDQISLKNKHLTLNQQVSIKSTFITDSQQYPIEIFSQQSKNMLLLYHTNGKLYGSGKLMNNQINKEVNDVQFDCEKNQIQLKTKQFKFIGKYFNQIVSGDYETVNYKFKGSFTNNKPFNGKLMLKPLNLFQITANNIFKNVLEKLKNQQINEIMQNIVINCKDELQSFDSDKDNNVLLMYDIASHYLYLNNQIVQFQNQNNKKLIVVLSLVEKKILFINEKYYIMEIDFDCSNQQDEQIYYNIDNQNISSLNNNDIEFKIKKIQFQLLTPDEQQIKLLIDNYQQTSLSIKIGQNQINIQNFEITDCLQNIYNAQIQINNNLLTYNGEISFNLVDKFDLMNFQQIFLEGVYRDKANAISYSGQFKNGQLNGMGVIKSNNGIQQGKFVNNELVEGRFERSDGVVFEI